MDDQNQPALVGSPEARRVLTRREFLKVCTTWIAGSFLSACRGVVSEPEATQVPEGGKDIEDKIIPQALLGTATSDQVEKPGKEATSEPTVESGADSTAWIKEKATADSVRAAASVLVDTHLPGGYVAGGGLNVYTDENNEIAVKVASNSDESEIQLGVTFALMPNKNVGSEGKSELWPVAIIWEKTTAEGEAGFIFPVADQPNVYLAGKVDPDTGEMDWSYKLRFNADGSIKIDKVGAEDQGGTILDTQVATATASPTEVAPSTGQVSMAAYVAGSSADARLWVPVPEGQQFNAFFHGVEGVEVAQAIKIANAESTLPTALDKDGIPIAVFDKMEGKAVMVVEGQVKIEGKYWDWEGMKGEWVEAVLINISGAEREKLIGVLPPLWTLTPDSHEPLNIEPTTLRYKRDSNRYVYVTDANGADVVFGYAQYTSDKLKDVDWMKGIEKFKWIVVTDRKQGEFMPLMVGAGMGEYKDYKNRSILMKCQSIDQGNNCRYSEPDLFWLSSEDEFKVPFTADMLANMQKMKEVATNGQINLSEEEMSVRDGVHLMEGLAIRTAAIILSRVGGENVNPTQIRPKLENGERVLVEVPGLSTAWNLSNGVLLANVSVDAMPSNSQGEYTTRTSIFVDGLGRLMVLGTGMTSMRVDKIRHNIIFTLTFASAMAHLLEVDGDVDPDIIALSGLTMLYDTTKLNYNQLTGMIEFDVMNDGK